VNDTEGFLAWVDLETTGLEPFDRGDGIRSRILEIGIIVTDGDLGFQHAGPNLQIDESILLPDGVVKEMHEKNGLLQEVAKSTVSLEDAEQQCLRFLEPFGEPGTIPMAGSSVHFDRKFLNAYMPQLHDWFGYRNVDVSSFHEMWKRWLPQVYGRCPEKRDLHRTRPDLEDSINLLRYYRGRVMEGHARVSTPW